MKRVSVYLKLRVIGAIDSMPGTSIKSRIMEVSKLTFNDEDGIPHVFTWRTIQTWLSIYKQYGVSAIVARPRSDKGKHRKVSREDLLEAIETVLPEFRVICRPLIVFLCRPVPNSDRNERLESSWNSARQALLQCRISGFRTRASVV